ncbi:unnamed protein product [Onchocerca flexuosa]|uniref:Retrovirus-related Pol polyprotein from transposon TNT 1-94 n=1 Tax=Onchocerca flexuosa TaxID=387005 RepID=A0A183HRL2_9BILA|nr:unnamed protein product [Onchocerca flexuosa]
MNDPCDCSSNFCEVIISFTHAVSIELHNIEFPLTYSFWKEAGAVFAKYLRKMSKVLIYKMTIGEARGGEGVLMESLSARLVHLLIANLTC